MPAGPACFRTTFVTSSLSFCPWTLERALDIRCQALSSCSDPLPHFGPLSSLLSCPLSFHCLQTRSPDCEHPLGTLCVHLSRAFPDTHVLCDFSFHHLPLLGCPVLFLHSSDHTLSLLSAFLFVFFVLFVYWIHCCLFSNLSGSQKIETLTVFPLTCAST